MDLGAGVGLAMVEVSRRSEVDERVQHSILRYVGNTPLERIRLADGGEQGPEVYAKLEFFNPGGSIKDRPMLRMVVEAIKAGELTEHKVLLDSTSGNAGIAYAMIAGVLGRKVELVLPGTTSSEIRKTIQSFGASTIITDPAAGYIGAIEKVHELYEAHGWTRVDKEAQTNSGGKRIESLWLSPRTVEALQMPKQAALF